jgi:hypothetical protein
MRIFRQPINSCIASTPSDAPSDTTDRISAQAKDDLMKRAGFLKSKHKWLPFSKEFFAPLIWHKEFVSDAAGLCDSADPASEPGWNVGFREDGMIIYAKFTWPSVFIQQKRDEKQTRSDLTSPLSTRGI